VQAEKSDFRLRVCAPPRDIHDIGERLWLEIEAGEMAHTA
jgi:hypothetical protein